MFFSVIRIVSPPCGFLVSLCTHRIRWAHNLAGIPSPTDSPFVHPISRAAKRFTGTRLVNKKEPISPDMITKLVEYSNLDNLLDLRNACIFILTIAGSFFFFSE